MGYVHEYMRWTNEVQLKLSGALHSADVIGLVVTTRHLALGAVQPPAAATAMIDEELRRLRSDLRTIVEQAVQDQRHWQGVSSAVVVPDTNVLVHHPTVTLSREEVVDLLDLLLAVSDQIRARGAAA